jgi:hypothetical protein
MGFGPNEMRNYVYLRGLLDTFEKRVLQYCSGHDLPEVRFRRIIEIRDALIQREELPPQVNVAGGVEGKYPNCDSDEVCRGTACVPDTADPDWPEGSDPSSWNA